jgi:hypothetical protein
MFFGCVRNLLEYRMTRSSLQLLNTYMRQDLRPFNYIRCHRKQELSTNTYISYKKSLHTKRFGIYYFYLYGRRGSAALTLRHPSIRKSWH